MGDAVRGGTLLSMKWRVGRQVPINVYEGDRPICQCHTVQDARRIVGAVNANGGLRWQPGVLTGCSGDYVPVDWDARVRHAARAIVDLYIAREKKETGVGFQRVGQNEVEEIIRSVLRPPPDTREGSPNPASTRTPDSPG